jgi:hypothetical protein
MRKAQCVTMAAVVAVAFAAILPVAQGQDRAHGVPADWWIGKWEYENDKGRIVVELRRGRGPSGEVEGKLNGKPLTGKIVQERDGDPRGSPRVEFSLGKDDTFKLVLIEDRWAILFSDLRAKRAPKDAPVSERLGRVCSMNKW